MVLSPVVDETGSDCLTFDACLLAHGLAEATRTGLAGLREQPGVQGSPPIPPRFLRSADEQTVLGMAAVLRAIADPALSGVPFGNWGVLAAQRFPGRASGAASFDRFVQGGLPAISPHLIPQHSLHSAASAISIALGFHGPHFGIGGGVEAVAEGLTAALTLFRPGSVPGLWLVFTEWDPEPVPGREGVAGSESVCRGLAMALVPGARSAAGLRLTVQGRSEATDDEQPSNWPTVSDLVASLSEARQAACRAWARDLPWGIRIEHNRRHQRQKKAA